ncbi:hypothetical protein SELMODRAFT_413254 [Selaginella moellendorffii]|uniref:Uncharacterized protein n=1 Tax=Selaginella moellendorffii TaxID=88036 RepID=D8RNV0_SELML|nr:hypothetical protein SELMODRAFT_413254 [Selaginella moellendorffii]
MSLGFLKVVVVVLPREVPSSLIYLVFHAIDEPAKDTLQNHATLQMERSVDFPFLAIGDECGSTLVLLHLFDAYTNEEVVKMEGPMFLRSDFATCKRPRNSKLDNTPLSTQDSTSPNSHVKQSNSSLYKVDNPVLESQVTLARTSCRIYITFCIGYDPELAANSIGIYASKYLQGRQGYAHRAEE